MIFIHDETSEAPAIIQCYCGESRFKLMIVPANIAGFTTFDDESHYARVTI